MRPDAARISNSVARPRTTLGAGAQCAFDSILVHGSAFVGVINSESLDAAAEGRCIHSDRRATKRGQFNSKENLKLAYWWWIYTFYRCKLHLLL
ncbi:hypothetical protein Y032_0297g1725 [Ancylostoma ceylanicum]|nr:hypothetical protein Y032_0297g1725 [Ancylostoma ceylanicum]